MLGLVNNCSDADSMAKIGDRQFQQLRQFNHYGVANCFGPYLGHRLSRSPCVLAEEKRNEVRGEVSVVSRDGVTRDAVLPPGVGGAHAPPEIRNFLVPDLAALTLRIHRETAIHDAERLGPRA